MEMERSAIVAAINSTPNLTEAAHKLGASRRTLQNRMREYGMPRGKSGRPKEPLPHHRPHIAGTTDLLLLGAVGAGLFFARKFLRSGADTVAGSSSVTYLRGIDAVL